MSNSFSYSRYDKVSSRSTSSSTRSRNRTTLGYWLPLAVTVTVATIGVVAWIWNERSNGGDDGASFFRGRDDSRETYEEVDIDEEELRRRRDSRRSRRRSGSRREGGEKDGFEERQEEIVITDNERRNERRDEEEVTIREETIRTEEQDGSRQRSVPSGSTGGTLIARVSDAIRRTPSPLQVFERVTGRTFGFGERETWEEEVERRSTFGGVGGTVSGTEAVERDVRQQAQQHRQTQAGRRKVVAVVVSAESVGGDQQDEEPSYHASILSNIPQPPNPESTQLLVLVYAPHLTFHPLSPKTPEPPPSPGKALYNHLARTAQPLLQHETHFLPFTVLDSQVNLLRHIAPNVVYIEESLASAEVVSKIRDWVGQVVVVIGAGSRALVDTETESEGEVVVLSNSGGTDGANKKWWMDERMVGLGKGVEVVEAVRVEEDWAKRVGT